MTKTNLICLSNILEYIGYTNYQIWRAYLYLLFHHSQTPNSSVGVSARLVTQRQQVRISLTAPFFFIFHFSFFNFIFQFHYLILFYVILLPIFDKLHIPTISRTLSKQDQFDFLLLHSIYSQYILISFILYSILISQKSGQLSWLKRLSSNPKVAGLNLTGSIIFF